MLQSMAIDLNADLGEGVGDDAGLLELVTSANLACGFHAGDPVTMRRVAALAADRGVAIGAHVGYHDREHFGRRPIAVAPEELAADVLYQLGALEACCRAAGTRVRYVKPHGALYNTAARDPETAEAIVDGVRAFGGLPVLALPGCVLAQRAEAAGLPAVAEGFADRAYAPDGSLVPRGEPGAVLEDQDAIAAQAMELAGGVVRSICVHGDTPGAVAAARRVRAALEAAGLPIEAFA
jgi:UPF0271 protein